MKAKEEFCLVEKCSYLNIQIFEDQPKTTDGFAAAFYSFPENPRLIFIVYRGSYESVNWYNHNINIILQRAPSITERAIRFAQQVKAKLGDDYQYIVTGYSLGSSLAIPAGLAINARVIAFDCPGYFGTDPGEKSQLVSVYQSHQNLVNWNAASTLSKFEVQQLKLPPKIAKMCDDIFRNWDFTDDSLVSGLFKLIKYTVLTHSIENIHEAISLKANEQGSQFTEQISKPLLLGLARDPYPFLEFMQDCYIARTENSGNTNSGRFFNPFNQFLQLCSRIRNGDPDTIRDMTNYFRISRGGSEVMSRYLTQNFNVDLGSLTRINGLKLFNLSYDSPLLSDYRHLFDPLISTTAPDLRMPASVWQHTAMNLQKTPTTPQFIPYPMPANTRALAKYTKYAPTPVGNGHGLQITLPKGVDVGVGFAGSGGLIISISGALDAETLLAMAPYGLALGAAAACFFAVSFYLSEKERRIKRELNTHQDETVAEQTIIHDKIRALPSLQGTESHEAIKIAREQNSETLKLLQDHIDKLHKRAGRAWKFGEDKITSNYEKGIREHEAIKNQLENRSRELAALDIYVQFIKPMESLDAKDLSQAIEKTIEDFKYHPDGSMIVDQLGDFIQRRALMLLEEGNINAARSLLNDVAKIQFGLSGKLEAINLTGCQQTNIPSGFDFKDLQNLLDNPNGESLDCWLDIAQKIHEQPEEAQKEFHKSLFKIAAMFIENEIHKLFYEGKLDKAKAKLTLWGAADEINAEKVRELNAKIDLAKQNENANDSFWIETLKREDTDLSLYATFHMQDRASKYMSRGLSGKAANIYKALSEKYPKVPEFQKLTNQNFFGHDQPFIAMAVSAFENMLLNYVRSNEHSKIRSLVEGISNLNQYTSAVNLNVPKLLAEGLWSKYQGRTKEFQDYFWSILPSLLDSCMALIGRQIKSKITKLESLITILQVLEVGLILIDKVSENKPQIVKYIDEIPRVKWARNNLGMLIRLSPVDPLTTLKRVGKVVNYFIELPDWSYQEFLANYRLTIQTLKAVSSLGNLLSQREFYAQQYHDYMNIGVAGGNIISRGFQWIYPFASEQYKVVAGNYFLASTLQTLANSMQAIALIEARNSKIAHVLVQAVSYIYTLFCQYSTDHIMSKALSSAIKHLEEYRKVKPVDSVKVQQTLMNMADILSNKLQYNLSDADFKNVARIHHFNQTVIDLPFNAMIQATNIVDSRFISEIYKIPAYMVLKVIVEQRLAMSMENDVLNFYTQFTSYMKAIKESATDEWRDKNADLLIKIEKDLITNFFRCCIKKAIKTQQNPQEAQKYLNLLFLPVEKHLRWKRLLNANEKYYAGALFNNIGKIAHAELLLNGLNPSHTSMNLIRFYDEQFKTLRNARSEYKHGKRALKSGDRVNALGFFSRSQALYQQIDTENDLQRDEIDKRLGKMSSMCTI